MQFPRGSNRFNRVPDSSRGSYRAGAAVVSLLAPLLFPAGTLPVRGGRGEARRAATRRDLRGFRHGWTACGRLPPRSPRPPAPARPTRTANPRGTAWRRRSPTRSRTCAVSAKWPCRRALERGASSQRRGRRATAPELLPPLAWRLNGARSTAAALDENSGAGAAVAPPRPERTAPRNAQAPPRPSVAPMPAQPRGRLVREAHRPARA